MFQYKVYAPSPALQPFVNNYAIVENTVPITHFVLMKPTLVLGIQYSGSMELSGTEQAVFEGFSSGLIGLQHTYCKMEKAANTGVLFINFTEAGAAAFFNLPLHELSDTGHTLDLMIPASLVSQLEEQVALATSAEARVQAVNRFLMTRLRYQKSDPLIGTALELIKNSQGLIKTKALAKQLYISSSRLEKRFRHAVGTSPKQFAAIVRIETALKNFQSGIPLTQLAYSAGYFDQAHFNRDIKRATGMTPRQLMGSLITTSGTVQQPCGFLYGNDVLLTHINENPEKNPPASPDSASKKQQP